MKQIPPLLEPTITKINRATEQVESLAMSIANWANENPILVKAIQSEDKLVMRWVVEEWKKPPPLETWKSQVGECAHNLRSSLENMAYALARLKQDPPQRPGAIEFPIYTDENEFIKKGKRKIDQLPDEAADFIERFQPFQRGKNPGYDDGTPDSDPLVFLQHINNSDKHRIPRVALLNVQELNRLFSYRMDLHENPFVGLSATHVMSEQRIYPGSIIAEMHSKEAITFENVTTEVKGKVVLDTPLGEQEVIELLLNLQKYVASVASPFERFFK